jgi:predicted HTH domain antitoxin
MVEFETLMVKIPKEMLLGIKKDKFTEHMKFYTAMSMYEEDILSLGKAAELAGINKDKFMEALSEHGRDVIRYSKEDLDEEIKFLRSIR